MFMSNKPHSHHIVFGYGCLIQRRRQWHPTLVLLPGKSHGWRSLVGYGVAKSRTWLSDFPFTFHFHALDKEMATHSSVLAWRIPGTGEPGGLTSMGSHRFGHDWSDLAAAAACMDMRVGLWRKLSAEELMLLNCGVGEDTWESLGLQGDPTSLS